MFCCGSTVFYGRVLMTCFFFQAEDGIRGLVRSRGLGDVYKRQANACVASMTFMPVKIGWLRAFVTSLCSFRMGGPPVSYTHLTLPTSDLV